MRTNVLIGILSLCCLLNGVAMIDACTTIERQKVELARQDQQLQEAWDAQIVEGYGIRLIEVEALEPVTSWLGTDLITGEHHYRQFSRCRANYWYASQDPYVEEAHSLELSDYGGRAHTWVGLDLMNEKGEDFVRPLTEYPHRRPRE